MYIFPLLRGLWLWIPAKTWISWLDLIIAIAILHRCLHLRDPEIEIWQCTVGNKYVCSSLAQSTGILVYLWPLHAINQNFLCLPSEMSVGKYLKVAQLRGGGTRLRKKVNHALMLYCYEMLVSITIKTNVNLIQSGVFTIVIINVYLYTPKSPLPQIFPPCCMALDN